MRILKDAAKCEVFVFENCNRKIKQYLVLLFVRISANNTRNRRVGVFSFRYSHSTNKSHKFNALLHEPDLMLNLTERL